MRLRKLVRWLPYLVPAALVAGLVLGGHIVPFSNGYPPVIAP
jgi:hypothetical protein